MMRTCIQTRVVFQYAYSFLDNVNRRTPLLEQRQASLTRSYASYISYEYETRERGTARKVLTVSGPS